MLVLRFLLPLAGLFLLGLVAAWLVTKDRRYLAIAWKAVIVLGLLVVALMLLYLFERLLLLL